jgi:hypothetical protein
MFNMFNRVGVLAIAIAATGSRFAGAQCIPYSYNFNSLNVGDIIGQDGWVHVVPVWNHPVIALTAGFDGTRALTSIAGTSAQGAAHQVPHVFVYTPEHRIVVWSFKGKQTVNNANVLMANIFGPSRATDEGLAFGMTSESASGNVLRSMLAGEAGTTFGSVLTFGHWYEIQLVVDFGQLGGHATLRFRDLTAQQVQFTIDPLITDKPIGLTPTLGNYPLHWFFARIDSCCQNTSVLDDIGIDDPTAMGVSIYSHPQPTSVCLGGSASFTVIASGTGPFTHRWQKDGDPIDTSENPSAATSTLFVSNISEISEGSYGCVVTNSCGSTFSGPASLVICHADFNCDGQVDDSDFVPFAAAYNTLDCADPTMPSNCPSDLNRDGFVDDSDFVSFAAAYNQLSCN